jgi:hypothetical protein
MLQIIQLAPVIPSIVLSPQRSFEALLLSIPPSLDLSFFRSFFLSSFMFVHQGWEKQFVIDQLGA